MPSVNTPRPQRCPGERSTWKSRSLAHLGVLVGKAPAARTAARLLTRRLSLLLRLVPKSRQRRIPAGKPCRPFPAIHADPQPGGGGEGALPALRAGRGIALPGLEGRRGANGSLQGPGSLPEPRAGAPARRFLEGVDFCSAAAAEKIHLVR